MITYAANVLGIGGNASFGEFGVTRLFAHVNVRLFAQSKLCLCSLLRSTGMWWLVDR